jgi:plastocyanin
MRRRGLALALAVGLSLVSAPALAADQNVRVRNDFFDPRAVTINVGEKVTWRNEGILHNVKFDDGSFEEPPEPSSLPWTAERTFGQAGTFMYYCEAHGTRGGVGMAGTVTVVAPGQAPPTDTAAPVVSDLEARPRTACARRTRTCRRTRTEFEFTLSEAATVNGSVRKRGQRTRRFERAGVPGENEIRFSTRGLAPGHWRLTLVATDGSNNRSAPARTTFRVRR